MVSGVWIPKGLRKHLSFSSSQHQQQRILAKSNPTECIRILQIYNSTGNLYYWQLLMQKEKTKLCSNTDGMVDSRQAWQSMYTLHVILSSFFVAFWASNFACKDVYPGSPASPCWGRAEHTGLQPHLWGNNWLSKMRYLSRLVHCNYTMCFLTKLLLFSSCIFFFYCILEVATDRETVQLICSDSSKPTVTHHTNTCFSWDVRREWHGPKEWRTSWNHWGFGYTVLL